MPLKRIAIFVHRWLGVPLSLFFLLWFSSAIGMMYWDFPSVTGADRLDRSPALDPSTIHLSPAEAFAALGQSQPPTEVRLNTFDGRPVYRFRVGGGESLVYADTGERQLTVTKDMALRIASAWVRQPPSGAKMQTIDDADQWTVQESFLALRPMSKYSWPNGEHVYVSLTSGDVVQFTTTASRVGAYLGPIPHWLYFTPLRTHQSQWSSVVIWSSGIGTFAAILGLVLGVSTYSPSRPYRRAGAATSIPYRGRKRWHMIFGLIFGLGATWAFSGMLSMDPFPTTGTSVPTAGRAAANRGGIPEALRSPLQLGGFTALDPREAISRLRDLHVKELELMSFSREPVYIASLGGGDTRIVTPDGRVRGGFDRQRMIEIATKAAAPAVLADIRAIDQYDRYYLDRHRQRPLPVILARLKDAEHTRYYIDPKTARVVGSYSSRNWVSRWLYHGLHSLDVPWLYSHRPAWDIVVISFMLGGNALCVTSLMLAWRVLRRTLTRSLGPASTSADALRGEDLITDSRLQ